MLEVKRKDGEGFDEMLRRFTRKTIESGKVLQFKKIRFHNKGQNKTASAASAKHRVSAQKKISYLRKIGKLEEPTNRRR